MGSSGGDVFDYDHGNIDAISYGYDLNQLRKKNGLPPCVDENFVPIKAEVGKLKAHRKRYYKQKKAETEKKTSVKIKK